MHCDGCSAAGSLLADAGLNLDGGLRGGVGGRKRSHDLVADGLDNAPSEVLASSLGDGQAVIDDGARFVVAKQFVQLGAAGDVGEKNREVARRRDHAERAFCAEYKARPRSNARM